MSKTGVFQTRQQQFGWDTSSHDYNEHLKELVRTPTSLPEVPHYPNVHAIFKNKVTYEENKVSPDEQLQKQNPSCTTKVAKKVNVTDQREIIGEDKNGKVLEVNEESVEAEADSFIQRKHKGFELHKWKSFKM